MRYFFLALAIFAGLFMLVQPAHAIFGVGDVGIFDIPSMQLDALDFIDNVVMRLLIVGFLLMVEAQIFVTIAGLVLDWAVQLPTLPFDNALITSGRTFIVGIVNLFLVLIVVAMAFMAIFRADAFQMKKALPRLIIAALLVNFSSLFVGVFVDISQVFINTIRDAVGSFTSLAVGQLSKWTGPVIVFAGTALGLKLGLALIPIGNVVSAVATGGLFLADLLLWKGWFLQGIVLTIFNFATGAMFLLFAFLFIARIVVIALLTIVAPLALAAAVLPQTKKYWDQWVHALLSWSMLGVVALFLMGLGMKLFSVTVAPLGIAVKGLNAGFLENVYIYLFLLVYLFIAFVVSRKFTALGAEALIAQTKSFAGKGASIGGKLLKEGWGRDLASHKQTKEALEAKETSGEKLSFKESLQLTTLRSKKMTNASRWAYRTAFGTTPEITAQGIIEQKQKEYERKFGKDVDEAAASLGANAEKLLSKIVGTMNTIEKAALGLHLTKTKGGEGFNKLSEDSQQQVLKAVASIAPKQLEDIIKHSPDLVDGKIKGNTHKEIADLVQRTLVGSGVTTEEIEVNGVKKTVYKDKDVQKISETAKITDPFQLIRKAAYKKAVDAMKTSDLENADRGLIESAEFREAVVKWKPTSFVRRMMEEWGGDIANRLQHTAEKEIGEKSLSAKERLTIVAKTNPQFIQMAYSGAGQAFMREYEGIKGRDAAKKFVADALAEAAAETRARNAPTYTSGVTPSPTPPKQRRIRIPKIPGPFNPNP